jgi:hypothetical protein
VKSTYVGRGEVAHMVARLESSSAELGKLLRAKKSIEALESERAEVAWERAVELIQLFTQASLITAGFHTHKRQWRRKRNGPGC